MIECYCVYCHKKLECVAIVGDSYAGFVCTSCDSIWQVGEEFMSPRFDFDYA